MEQLTDMLVDLTDSPGFQRAGLSPISRPLALILLGGLRELTALLVEDGSDLREHHRARRTSRRSPILGAGVSPA